MKLNSVFGVGTGVFLSLETVAVLGDRCRCNPDPHFKTFDGTRYDFHGGCDTVLVNNQALNMFLHIRTVPYNAWGGITNAALRIAGDVLEVFDNGDYYFNNVLGDALSWIGPYQVVKTPGVAFDVFEVDLTNGQFVWISTGGNTGGISIDVEGDAVDFGNSVGLCGTWGTPGMIDRTGGTVLTGSAFGEAWQVTTTEPQLFQTAAPPQAPDTCVPGPPGIGEVGEEVTKHAEEVCEHVVGPDFDNCVFDVIATGDESWAQAPFYNREQCVSADDNCKKKGGECVMDCEKLHESHYCDDGLCEKKIPEWMFELKTFNKEFRCFCAIPKK